MCLARAETVAPSQDVRVLAPVRETWNHRSIIRNLTERELKAKYKKSVLGWVWSLLNPLATLVIYSIVFGTFLKIKPPVGGNGDLQVFALYLFAALVMWNFFNAVVNGSMAAMTSAGPLIRKVYLPPECIVFSVIGAAVLQTSVEALILAVIMIVVGNASFTFLLFPVVLLMFVLFTAGISMVVSLLNVYYRDVGYLVAIAMNFLFYATPIVYTITIVPKDVRRHPRPRDHRGEPDDAVRAGVARHLLRAPGPEPGQLRVHVGVVGRCVRDRMVDLLRRGGRRRRGALSSVTFGSSSTQAVVVDDISKRFRLYTDRPSNLKQALTRFRRVQYEEFWALRNISLDVQRGRVVRAHRPQRLGEVDAAPADGAHPPPDDRHGADERPRLGAARARRRVPPRALGPREHLPQRRDPRAQEARDRRGLRRDRRVRRAPGVHRLAGEGLLERHVRAARLRGRGARRTPTS